VSQGRVDAREGLEFHFPFMKQPVFLLYVNVVDQLVFPNGVILRRLKIDELAFHFPLSFTKWN